jgi:hypothetical protein
MKRSSKIDEVGRIKLGVPHGPRPERIDTLIAQLIVLLNREDVSPYEGVLAMSTLMGGMMWSCATAGNTEKDMDYLRMWLEESCELLCEAAGLALVRFEVSE